MTTLTFTYPHFDHGDVDVEAHLSYDGEEGSLSLPCGFYVDDLIVRKDGAPVALSDDEYQAIALHAVDLLGQGRA